MTLLKRRHKEETPVIKRRHKVEKVKIQSEEKVTTLKIKRRDRAENGNGKKKCCTKHKEVKIYYTSEECSLCESNKLISSLCQTIDDQRQTIKKGFEVVYKKLLLGDSHKEKHECTSHAHEGVNLKEVPKIKRRKRKIENGYK